MFENPAKRAERFAMLSIMNRLYTLSTIISNEGLMNSVTDGKKRKIINPWYDDSNQIQEMIKSASQMNSTEFLRVYGKDLEDLELSYL